MDNDIAMIAALSECAEALGELLAQLEAVGIYIPGQDAGQWAECSGLSFAQAETALMVLDSLLKLEAVMEVL